MRPREAVEILARCGLFGPELLKVEKKDLSIHITGHIKDTPYRFKYVSGHGSGFTYMDFTAGDLRDDVYSEEGNYSLERSVQLVQDWTKKFVEEVRQREADSDNSSGRAEEIRKDDIC